MPHTVSDGIPAKLMPKWEDAHPWLLPALVVMSLGSRNVNYFTLADVLAMLGLTLLPITVGFLVLVFIRRSARHAALLTSWISLLVFYYGSLCDGLATIPNGGGAALHHGVLISIGVGVTAVIWNLAGELKSLSKFVSLTMLIPLLCFSAKLGMILVREPRLPQIDFAKTSTALSEVASAEDGRPDIYYIVLDSYSRGDVLQKSYDFDNSEFLDGLRQRGFYVAEKSSTNYTMTAFSLSSTLNMRYHESFNPQWGFKSLAQMLRVHEVGQNLRDCGYQLIHFNTYFMPTACSEISHLSLGEPTTWLPVGTRTLAIQMISHSAFNFCYGGEKGIIAAEHRRAFRQLAEIPKLRGPKFTFCHLITPHKPYVFTRDGQTDWNLDQTSPKVYVDQVVYLNREVMRTIDAIRSKSKTPPIIIVQSDHGPGRNLVKGSLDHVQGRIPILNAYLVPESMRSELYPTITPVNTFRLLFSKCFGFDYAPLPDRNFLIHETIWSSIMEVSDKVHDGTPEPGLLSPAALSKVNSIAKGEATTQMD
ncbi:MAG: hypothetical protein FJ302_06895 [Planctomycetes bacterium]|nr:hypothetical protein [Planctomycetota bacterium]